MPIAAAISGAAALGSAAISGYGANKAVKAQQGMFNTARQGLKPFMDAGTAAINPLMDLITPGKDMSGVLSRVPGYQFTLDQGLKAITNNATTKGMGGNFARAAADFATGTAQEKSFLPIVNALQAMVNTGANAGGNVASAATTAGQGIAGSIASGTNAVGGAVNQFGDNMSQYTLLSKMFAGGQQNPFTKAGGFYGNGTPFNILPN